LANSLPASKFKSRKVFFALTASIIIIVLIAGTVAALTFMSNPTENPQATENPNTTPTASPTVTINQPDALPQGYLSASQALEIAKPYYTQYAQGNNRTITEIRIIYSNLTADDSIQISPERWQYFSGWTVEAIFYRDSLNVFPSPPATCPPLFDPEKNYWDFAFCVVLRADTGQVVASNVEELC
jgi:hypothetical protein